MSGRISAVAGRNEDGKTLLYVGAASGGVWKSPGRRHHLQAGVRQAAGAVHRRHRDRPDEPADRLGGHGRVVDAQLRLGRRRHLQVDRRRRDLDQHGPARSRSASPASSCTRATATSSTPARPASCGATAPTAASTRPPTAARRWDLILTGPNLSTGCCGARHGPEEPRRALRRALGLPPQGLDVPLRAATARRAQRQRPLQVHRRRRELDGGDQRRLPRSPGAASRWPSRRRNSEASSTRFVESTDSALWRSDGRRQHLGEARQQPVDGLAAVLLRAAW